MRVRSRNTELVNENIPTNQEVLLIDDNGDNLGKMVASKAMKIANDKDLDLVVVSPDSNVMVAKLMDYSKYRFEQQKRLREMKKNQVTVDVKEIRLSPTIGDHDLNTKLKQAAKFIKSGDKVKITLRFRGRMITHNVIGREVMDSFIEKLGDSIIVESKPKLEGYQMIAVIAPNTK